MRKNSPVILQECRMTSLAYMRDKECGQVNLVGNSKEEITDCISSKRTLELDLPVDRVHILNGLTHVIELVTGLHIVSAKEPGVCDLGIQEEGILPLRISRLSTNAAVSADCDRGQTTSNSRVAGSSGHIEITRIPQNPGILPCFRKGRTEARFQKLRQTDLPRQPECDLLIDRAEVSIAPA